MTLRGLAVALTILGTGCAGSSSGSVAGFGLRVEDAVFVETIEGRVVRSLAIVLGDRPRLCEGFQSASLLASTTTLTFELLRPRSAVESALGAYQLGLSTQDQPYGRVVFNRTDGDCAPMVPLDAASGSGAVTLEELTLGEDGLARGRFKVSFGDDELSGGFSARRCERPRSAPTSGCQ